MRLCAFFAHRDICAVGMVRKVRLRCAEGARARLLRQHCFYAVIANRSHFSVDRQLPMRPALAKFTFFSAALRQKNRLKLDWNSHVVSLMHLRMCTSYTIRKLNAYMDGADIASS